MDGMTFLRLSRQLKCQGISYLKYFHDPPNFNLTTNCAHVMENLIGRRSIWWFSLTNIYSGVTPSTSRGHNTVSISSLNDPRRRLRSASGVLLQIVCWGAGLIDGQERSTCMFSRAAVGLLIFAKMLRFVVCVTVIWCV